MPRNSSGTFSLPLPAVVTGTVIESVWANTSLDDLAQNISESLDRYGRGGMLAPLRNVDGIETLPALTFTAETGTGFWRAGPGELALSILGVRVGEWTSDGYAGPIKNADPINVRDGPGFVGDGVHDDTEAIRAVHTYANSINGTVSYAGVKSFAIQANARIPVQTSVDFAGAEVKPINGVTIPPFPETLFDIVTYDVTDPTCPFVTVSGAVAAADLLKGSMFPTRGLFDGHGFALVTAGLQIPTRDETATTNYKQSFKVNRNGEVSYGLSADLSAFAANISIGYRKTSLKTLTISNLCIREDRANWNDLNLVAIQRCNVVFENFTLLPSETDVTPYDNRNGIIAVYQCSDVKVRNIIATGCPVTEDLGSYILSLTSAADVYVEKMNALTGWGAQYGENINGVHFTDCVINRVDCHASCHNLFVDKCAINSSSGIQYGWGGGLLKVTNTVFNRSASMIRARPDYGGQHFGTLEIDDCEYVYPDASNVVFVELGFNNMLGSPVIAVQAPNVIINNVRRLPSATAVDSVIVLFRLQAKANTVVYSPRIISVTNVACSLGWSMNALCDWENMEANPDSPVLQIVMDGVHATSPALNSRGLRSAAKTRTVTNPIDVRISIADSDNAFIYSRYLGKLSAFIADSSVNGVDVDLTATTMRVGLSNCRLDDPGVGYTNAPIGGIATPTGTPDGGFTTMSDCIITSGAFNLSRVAAFQGNLVRNSMPLMPAGVTPVLMFSGYQAPGVFAGAPPTPTVEYPLTGPALPAAITFTRASVATVWSAAGVLLDSAVNAPRFDYDPVTLEARGLRQEGARTNSLQNNTMVGALAPSTLPAGWLTTSSTGGLTRQVVGTGIEDGINYVDLRYFGTTTTAATINIAQFMGSQEVAALQNETWFSSVFLRIVGGDLTNVTAFQLSTNDRRADGSGAGGTNTTVPVEAANLRAGRVAQVRTMAASTTAFVTFGVTFLHAALGDTIDFTIRIGLPQLEKGRSMSSVIKTANAGSVTRSPDIPVVLGAAFSAFWNPLEGTISVAGVTLDNETGASPCFAAASDGTGNNALAMVRANASGYSGWIGAVAGVQQAALAAAPVANNALATMCGSYKLNNYGASTNGSVTITDTAATVPTVDRLHLGSLGGAQPLNGWIKSFRYWNTRLSDAQTQSAS